MSEQRTYSNPKQALQEVNEPVVGYYSLSM